MENIFNRFGVTGGHTKIVVSGRRDHHFDGWRGSESRLMQRVVCNVFESASQRVPFFEFFVFWGSNGGPLEGLGANFSKTFCIFLYKLFFLDFGFNLVGGAGGRGGARQVYRICRFWFDIYSRPATPVGCGKSEGFAPSAGPLSTGNC